ncbi:DNA internalization-related competence protein ComEC/Rec2 [Pediococcus claussenii ATCC BAA-344]|uniref:DNA internalization-related competence protein ComEC/Rec2 n=3 Tax=Pediococcus claussenii TaxID=187452 RepID=G8PCY3_PEDCP|nr:DNA internalization-related competence protein ComEC/Rec2 [Pediococcus claussenii ATCC BAA-344]KRN18877.1 hypothetical protein IV79_GL000303 [Pediococcus claussenii]
MLVLGFYFSHKVIFAILGIAWIVRAVCLRSKLILIAMLLTSGMAIFVCHRVNKNIEVGKALVGKKVEHLRIKAETDQVKIDGDQFIIRGVKNDLTGLPIMIYGSLNNINEKYFLSQNRPLFLKLNGVVGVPVSPTNFNQSDSRIFSYSKGVFLTLEKAKIDRMQIRQTFSIVDWLHCFREKLVLRCNSFEEPIRGYVLGAVLGYQDEFMQQNSEKYKNTGIIHLFCISGLHVFFLVDGLKALFRRLRITKETSESLLLVLVPIYYVIGGGSTSLLRCISIVWINTFCSRFRLKQRNIDTWGLVLLINMYLNPFVLFCLGGQLSYLLSLILITLKFKNKVYQSIALFLVEIPSLLYFTYQVNILTVLFNLIFIPIFSVIILPCAICLLLVPGLNIVLGLPIIFFEVLIKMAEKMPGLILVGKPHANVVILLFIITLKLVTIDQNIKTYKQISGLAFVLYSCVYMLLHLVPYGEVSFFDVGQGDCILIREPFNRRISLIDTGGRVGFVKNGWKKRQKIEVPQANRTSVNYLKSLGISQIDNLCLTHQDVDHIGDTGTICKNFRVKRLIIGDGMLDSLGFKDKVKSVINRKTSIKSVKSGFIVRNFPFQVLYPEKKGKGANEDSLALIGTFGKQKFLFTGDLDQNGEKRMMEMYPELKVDVFKLGHHGSRTSNSDAVFDIAGPHVTITSAGRKNRFGHPHKETIEKIKKHHILNYSTQTSGMISYRYFENDSGRWITKFKGN